MDLDLLVRTSALLLIALVVTRVMGRATAATRHLIWHTTIVAVLLTPAIAVVAPPFRISLPSWMNLAVQVPVPAIGVIESNGEALCGAGSDCVAQTDRASAARLFTIAGMASAGAWLVGSWFLLGWLTSAWQARRATDAPAEWMSDARRLAARMGLSRMPAIRQARDAGSPRVAGLFRPVILLPSSAAAWTPADREAALLHELSHIRRADRRTQAVAQAVCALNWFNPLTWIAARALATERERACDDEVLKAGVRPSAYATLLLDLARSRQTWMAAAAIAMARTSTIEGRLLAILATDVETTPPSRRLGTRRSTRWLVMTGAVAVIAAVVGAQQQPSPQSVTGSRGATTKMGDPLLMNLDDRQDAAPIVKALARALSDPDRQVREQAALGLALVPGAGTVEPLLKALGDSDAQVREKAAIGLAFRRDPRVIDPLLDAINDSDAQVREKVAIALGASGDQRALSALEKALDDPDSQVREKAASGLILLGLRQ